MSRPPRRARLSAVLCLVICAGAHAGSPGDDHGWEKKSERWLEKIDAGAAVRVVNPYGNVYARFGGYENQVEILSTTQIIDRSAAPLTLRREVSGGSLSIDVVVEGFDRDTTPARGSRKDRVDLVLFVPQGAIVDVRTVGGEVQAKGLESRLTVATESGDIDIRGNKGHVDARSERGSISAMLESGVTADEQSFVTETGDIEIYLREDAGADVRLATSGTITSDFSMTVEHRPREEPGKVATVLAGSGGAPVSLYTKRGALRLLRLPRGHD